MGRGRPTEYRLEYCEKAHALAHQGATDREIAEALGINEATLYRWRHAHPEFRESLKLGKDAADERVENSLYRRAVGYSFDAIKINQYEGKAVITPYVEHVPPDIGAIQFWLKNRRKEEWRDRTEQSIQHGGVLAVKNAASDMTDEQLAAIANAGAAKQ